MQNIHTQSGKPRTGKQRRRTEKKNGRKGRENGEEKTKGKRGDDYNSVVVKSEQRRRQNGRRKKKTRRGWEKEEESERFENVERDNERDESWREIEGLMFWGNESRKKKRNDKIKT